MTKLNQQKIIKLEYYEVVPREFTGIVMYPSGAKIWYKEGLPHREDGPAIERSDGTKEWWLDGKFFSKRIDISDKIFLGIEKGKYSFEWLKFMTEDKIEEYPLIPRMEPYEFKLIKTFDLADLLNGNNK